MGVNDGHHIRPRLVDFAVNEAFEKHRPAAGIDRLAVEIEFHDVSGGDQRRRQRPRHQKMIWVGRMARADMAEGVDNAEVGENAAARHDIVDQGWLDARNWAWRSLGARRRQARQNCECRECPEAREPIAHCHGRLLTP